MENYIVITRINSTNYMTRVESTTLLAAEHLILDHSYCGKCEYGVNGCIAYDVDGMKTDTFVYDALNSNTVSVTELIKLIEENNNKIIEKEKKEKRREEIKKEIEKLQAELKELI